MSLPAAAAGMCSAVGTAAAIGNGKAPEAWKLSACRNGACLHSFRLRLPEQVAGYEQLRVDPPRADVLVRESLVLEAVDANERTGVRRVDEIAVGDIDPDVPGALRVPSEPTKKTRSPASRWCGETQTPSGEVYCETV